jgi:eukaryotic-like serine/threonine-protein kinase
MTISFDQFRRDLVEHGLMAAEKLSQYLDTFPPEKRPHDPEMLARELVRDEKLTCHQARLMLEGKASSLVLGDYLILRKIGKGGMGEVVKAVHRRLDRFAAIKVLRSETLGSVAAVQRFRQEVKAAARLSHANIVTTYDAGEQHGFQYLVMEYVDGCDLAAWLKKHGPMSVAVALACILQAARGLKYAHSRNVLHRDIKPSNLLLDSEGTVKILDMGLARITGTGEGSSGGTLAERLTRTGQTLGTVDYISPEQAEDTRRADHRSDIYSLGCTLYSLLTGRPIYAGETATLRLIAHREGRPPSLRETVAGVPESLERVFRKMVAKDPADRYQSMAEVVDALEMCLEAIPSAPRQTPDVATGLRAPPSPSRLMDTIVGERSSLGPSTGTRDHATRLGCGAATKAIAAKTAVQDAPLLTADEEQPTADGHAETLADHPDATPRCDADQ